MKSRRNDIISTIIGAAAGLATAAALFFTVGVGVMFSIFWGCSPYHRVQPDPEPCSALVIPITLLVVTAICLLCGWPVFRWVKRTAARRLKR